MSLKFICYLGWLHSVLMTGTLCFGADGCLVWGKHNFPGSWNDSSTSFDFQMKLIDPRLTWAGGKVASDSAFPVSGLLEKKIITPLKDGDLERIPAEARAGAIRMNSAITSVRQAAEWGMGAVEKVWRILLLPLPFSPEQRRMRLKILYRLYNLRVRTTGISQIRTVYDNHDE